MIIISVMSKYGYPEADYKNTYLDRPTSHGGWPNGHPGSYADPNTPVFKQIRNYLESMGLMKKKKKESEEKNLKEVREYIRQLILFEVLGE